MCLFQSTYEAMTDLGNLFRFGDLFRSLPVELRRKILAKNSPPERTRITSTQRVTVVQLANKWNLGGDLRRLIWKYMDIFKYESRIRAALRGYLARSNFFFGPKFTKVLRRNQDRSILPDIDPRQPANCWRIWSSPLQRKKYAFRAAIDKYRENERPDFEFKIRNQLIDSWGVNTLDDLHFKYLVDQGQISRD